MKQAHLLVCISGHGFGHVAQTAPVLNALKQLVPELQLTIRSSVPLVHLRSRIPHEFNYVQEAVDPGMLMVSALEVDATRSLEAYAEFHQDWEARIEDEARLIGALKPDVVLSNVAYLPLAGAARLEIPAVAMCSLNWADILRDFCGDMPGAAAILQQIEQAYLQSDFLRLTPAMPMPWLEGQHLIGPVAQSRSNQREQVNKLLNIEPCSKLILASMGGIAMQFPVDTWPVIPDVLWLIPDGWQTRRSDCIPVSALQMDFSDVLASCDVLLTKPGYGAFVEAACAGVPVLYVKREAWPEQDILIDWLARHGSCAELEAHQLQTGEFTEVLANLLQREKPQPVEPTGTHEAAQHLAALLAN
jgi:hypothetical protein